MIPPRYVSLAASIAVGSFALSGPVRADAPPPELPACLVELPEGTTRAQIKLRDATIRDLGVESRAAPLLVSDCDWIGVASGVVRIRFAGHQPKVCAAGEPCRIPGTRSRGLAAVAAQVSGRLAGLSRMAGSDSDLSRYRNPNGNVLDPDTLARWDLSYARGGFWTLRIEDVAGGRPAYELRGTQSTAAVKAEFERGHDYAWTVRWGGTDRAGGFRLLDTDKAQALRDVVVLPSKNTCVSRSSVDIGPMIEAMRREALIFEQLLLLQRIDDDC